MYQFTHMLSEDDGIELFYSDNDLRSAVFIYALEIVKEDGIDSLLISLNKDNEETLNNSLSLLTGEANPFFYDMLKGRAEVEAIAQRVATDKFLEWR